MNRVKTKGGIRPTLSQKRRAPAPRIPSVRQVKRACTSKSARTNCKPSFLVQAASPAEKPASTIRPRWRRKFAASTMSTTVTSKKHANGISAYWVAPCLMRSGVPRQAIPASRAKRPPLRRHTAATRIATTATVKSSPTKVWGSNVTWPP
ncbi:hypothetical protein D3C86_1442480 [compost metagenome]